jgi:hypothetical protein
MLISQKQHAANRQNTQKSTGPKTPEGKEAVRFNALTWSLRARSLILPTEDSMDYQQLWNSLEADLQPQAHCEWQYMEQMAASQWLLTRNAASERRIHKENLELEKEFALLDRASVMRVRLEHSFTAALRQIKQLQKERLSKPQPQPEPTQPAGHAAPVPASASADSPAPPLDYVMAEGPQRGPIFCGVPVTPDTR